MEFFNTCSGKLKLVTVAFGIVATGLAGETYAPTRDKDVCFLSIVSIAMGLSFLLLPISIWKQKREKRQWRAFDIGYHILMGLLVGAGSIVFLVSVVELENLKRKIPTDAYTVHDTKTLMRKFGKRYTNDLAMRVSALVFGSVNAVLYHIIAFLVWIEKATISSGER